MALACERRNMVAHGISGLTPSGYAAAPPRTASGLLFVCFFIPGACAPGYRLPLYRAQKFRSAYASHMFGLRAVEP